MALAIAATTELQAVNIMLGTIGEAPVSSLTDTGLSELAIAKTTLDEVSRDLQKRGWQWNTDLNVTISIDGSNRYPVASDILRIRPMPQFRYLDVAIRNAFVWWRNPPDNTASGNSFVLLNVTPLWEVVLGIKFDELPETARRFITVRASRLFADREEASETQHGFTTQDESDALTALDSEEAEDANYNILRSNSAMSIWAGHVHPTPRR